MDKFLSALDVKKEEQSNAALDRHPSADEPRFDRDAAKDEVIDDDDEEMPPPQKRSGTVALPPKKRRKRRAEDFAIDRENAAPKMGDDEASEDNTNYDDLPMPARPGAPAGAVVNMRPTAHPFWASLFRRFNETPPPKSRCWGCLRGAIDVPRVPFEQYSRLVNELFPRVVTFGAESGCEWAGNTFRNNIVNRMNLPPAERALIKWSGVGILWHMCKHTYIEQYRQLARIMETTDMEERVSMTQLFSVPLGGDPVDDAVTGRDEVDLLNRCFQANQRAKSYDASKMPTHHPRLNADPMSMLSYVQHGTYSGAGILHES